MSTVLSRAYMARILVALFVSATMLAAVAPDADAARRALCRTNPENYSFYRGKCLSDKRIEQLKNRGVEHGRNHG